MSMVLSPPAPGEIAWAGPRGLARFHDEAKRDRAGPPAPPCGIAGQGAGAAFSHFPPAAAALAALAPRGCRWPLGEPAETGFAFCGAARLPRGSYCAAHARTARPGGARGGRA